MPPRRALATVVAATLALTLAACASTSKSTNGSATINPVGTTTEPPSTTTIPTGPLAVTRITVTFVDHSRATVDPSPDHPRSAPDRTLPTDIYIPAGPGPYPLIVHAHGAAGDPEKFTELLGYWAKAGYVIAAPRFPLSNDKVPGPTIDGDFQNQARDMHFVIEQVVALAAKATGPLAHKIDPELVGVSGVSLGGATTYGVAFNACCRDDRVKAAIIMDGIKLPFGNAPYHFAGTPILIFHANHDYLIPYKDTLPAYAAAAPPKYFVTLDGATHAEPYENTPNTHDALVMKTSLDFWDLYLRHEPGAQQRLISDAVVKGLSSLQDDLAGASAP